MKLWILKPVEYDDQIAMPWQGGAYGKYYGFVVRANKWSEARALAGNKAGGEGPDAWLDEHNSSCVELSTDGPEGVIISDFNAG